MGSSHSRNKSHEKSGDFENCKPAGDEQDVYDRVGRLLEQVPVLLQKIEEYTGCQELARQAMAEPTPENEKTAFEGLLGAVDSIAHFFEFSNALEQTVPDMLILLSTAAGSSNKELQHAAIFRQLGDVLAFALMFDQTRMMRPNLSNDFSYYRRLLPKFAAHPNVRVKDDEASGMALFTAEHIPMTKCLIKATNKAFERDMNTSVALSLLANSALSMVRTGRYSNPETNLFCARSMTGALVIFDHVVPSGVFHKRSPIPAQGIITTLQKEFAKEGALTNTIRFSSLNFKNAPNKIQNLFD